MRAREYNQTGVQLAAVPKGFKPPRDRPVRSTIVACPDCGQGIDERCVSIVTGQPAGPHRVRRRLALRAERDAR